MNNQNVQHLYFKEELCQKSRQHQVRLNTTRIPRKGRLLLKLLNVRVDKKRPVDETGLKDDDAFPFRMLLDYSIKEGHGSGLRGPRWR